MSCVSERPSWGGICSNNNSRFDGNDPGSASADDAAVATDKVALLPGGIATFANVSGYIRGINGVMIDVASLPDGDGSLSPDSFILKVGSGLDPAGWRTAPAPSQMTIRRGAGVGGSDRITLVWPDRAISDTWLQVVLQADGATGLALPDTFYFGNLVGESGDSDVSAAELVVSSLDIAKVKRSLNTSAGVNAVLDFNRDGRINALDVAALKKSLNHRLSLQDAFIAAALNKNET